MKKAGIDDSFLHIKAHHFEIEGRTFVRSTVIKHISPALLSITLFVLLIFLIIIPFINKALLSQKKDSVKKLIESSFSLVEDSYREFLDGRLTEGEAKKRALSILNALRYDEGMKNYFWINTIEPDGRSILVMHPYRADLVGTDVIGFQDPEGNTFFKEFTIIAREQGEGFSTYLWQYMGDTERIEAKISYVKYFEPWNWVIGTGLYIDDINREIKQIANKTSRYIFLVLLLISLLLIYITYTAIQVENEKNAAKKILLDSQTYLRTVIDKLPSALLNCDDDWFIRDCNSRAADLLEIGRDLIIGQSLAEQLPQMKDITHEIEIQNRDSRSFERKVMSIKDRDIIANVAVFAVRLKNYPRYIILIDDITTQVQKENQLMQAQKMETVGNLVGGIAHDFNNIIGGIIGTASILKMKCEDFDALTREQLAEYISLIEETGERAAEMVQHLLSLSRKQESRFTLLDLKIPVDHIYKMCVSSFDKCIEIKVLTPEEPALIQANMTMIEQVLLNLCINASHAMTIMRESGARRGGTLQIQVEKIQADDYFKKKNPDATESEYWCLSVQDTGVGISKKDISKIFEPFFSTKDKEQGSGLGLSMVYNIIKLHKGYIDIYSEMNYGTRLYIYLPKHNSDRLEIDKPQEIKALKRGTGTVLVIDDDNIIRSIAVEILEACGYHTLQAKNGEEGIEVFIKNREIIDLVYLDLVMPRKSGVEVFHRIKDIKPLVPILLSSGFKKDDRVEELIKLGIDGFLQKPYTAFELSRLVSDILKKI